MLTHFFILKLKLFYRVEVEQNLLNRKFKTLTAYYGELVDEEANYDV